MNHPLVVQETLRKGVERLRFNRPEKLNALSSEMVQELEQHLDRLAGDPEVRVLVLAGTGGKAFVAGADIAEYRDGRHHAFIAYQLQSRRVFDKLEAFPKPTLAAIQGYALGGGFEIALCCDILLCAQSARLGLPEGNLGLCPGGGGTQRLTRAIGRYAAADVMIAGRYLRGERAYQLGLASVVCADEDFEQSILDHTQAMLKLAPQPQAEIKALMRNGMNASLPTALSLEQEVLFRLYGTADAQEGINAFLEKRPPNFGRRDQ